jgi:hypothetical protein
MLSYLNGKRLVVLGCSATKVSANGALPAINLYDGPIFRVLRSFLRDYRWPESLSLAVLSAKYGMIGGVSQIETYDQRMTPRRAQELCDSVTETLVDWSPGHDQAVFVLGQDYVRSINRNVIARFYREHRVVEGPIGIKMGQFQEMLRSQATAARLAGQELPRLSRPLYFLPDWDDFIDENYDFINDEFSTEKRSERNEKHTIALMRPRRLCDGVLVSLAQHLGSKGLLKRVDLSGASSLAPHSVRDHFNLGPDQWAFGDCGAFSYVAEQAPTVSVEQAVALYDLHEFDLGASVDHIPVEQVLTAEGRRTLTEYERRKRVELTRDNADKFIGLHKKRRARFIPVGVIQGVGPGSYANQVGSYLDMGYRHLALGGLVPRTDAEILAIVAAVHAELRRHAQRPWLHLLGIFRPSLQSYFREVGIGGFDSASYFRKAWLRSDQNYLGTDGRWYAAIRVPPLRDPRMKLRLQKEGNLGIELEKLERHALKNLRLYAERKLDLEKALAAVLEYDRFLSRAELIDEDLVTGYRRTLEARPWESCDCPMCAKLGIDILIFRGKNRNKCRGAHNTLQLFRSVAR